MTYAIPGVRLFFIAFPMMGMNIVWTMKYQSQNRIGTSLFVSLFRGLLFLLISLFALSALFKMTGVWLSMPFTELACLGLLMFLHQHEKKKAA